MCNNNDSLQAYLRDKWAQPEPLLCQDARVVCVQHWFTLMYGDPDCCPKANIEGHICLQPRHWYQACTNAPLCHPRALSTCPSQSRQSESIQAIWIWSNGALPIQVSLSWLFVITYYYILKSYIILNLSHLRVVVGQLKLTMAVWSWPVVTWLCNAVRK